MIPKNGVDHSDRDDLLQCLLEAYARLDQHDQERRDFLTRAVHDLCAPLTAVTGYCGLLLEGALGPLTPAQEDALRRIERNAHRLSRTVTATLDLTSERPVASTPELRDDSIDDCIHRTLFEMRSAAGERDLSYNVQLSQAPPSLYFDADQIQYVLLNVLEQARSFAPKLGVIEISGYPFFWERRTLRTACLAADRRLADSNAPNAFRIDVRERGVPIPEEVASSWFDVFGPKSEGVTAPGGLGLPICKMMVRAHQGDLWVSSGIEGVTFSLVIPLRLKASGWDRTRQEASAAAFSEV